jgi:hypothetical protein
VDLNFVLFHLLFQGTLVCAFQSNPFAVGTCVMRKDTLSTNQCLGWIEQCPGLTLLLTEVTNYLVHAFLHPSEWPLPWEGQS